VGVGKKEGGGKKVGEEGGKKEGGRSEEACLKSGLLYLNASPTGLMHSMMRRLFHTLPMRYVNMVSGMSAIPSFLAASPGACLTCAYHRKEIGN